MGQIFPWQDPRDTAESRVQPVKERLRARQSISGLHLHNKWSSRGFSSACARAHTTHPLISTRRHKVAEMKKREKRRGQPSRWSGTPLVGSTRASTSILLDDTAAKLRTLQQHSQKRASINEKDK